MCPLLHCKLPVAPAVAPHGLSSNPLFCIMSFNQLTSCNAHWKCLGTAGIHTGRDALRSDAGLGHCELCMGLCKLPLYTEATVVVPACGPY
jgi:hypothetical protein